MNYLVTLSYDGSQFHGWAKQLHVRTVQEEVEKIIKQIFKKDITVYASGRTDAYVHALAQTFSFKTNKNVLKPKILLKALQNLAPQDIQFASVKEVDGMFNARFSSKSKTYRYAINLGKPDVFKKDYQFDYDHKLNLPLIKKATKLLVGEHNFKSFSTSELEQTTRTIYNIKICKSNKILLIEITGNGFLRNMVRMLVGSLLDLNEGKKTLNDIKLLLANPKKGSAISKAKACGLYLVKVKY
ncbi:MAG: tRNA pseudouridine(38-40) synthase TruA [Mycoplasmataceae bacterium]|jgi:tRNA pseudouridine38-40 synthase|nr:tRNA pseudouridine(38-40) synthase TruA [Mycoplasmataceae bacterium]